MALLDALRVARGEPPAVVADLDADRLRRRLVAHRHVHGRRSAVPQRVVDGLLHDQEQVAGDKLGYFAEVAARVHKRLGGVPLADARDERAEGLGKRLLADRQAPHRPHGAVQLARGMVHHPAGDFEVHLRIVLVLAAAPLAGIELETDPAERLQERVVEVGGKPIALRERGVKLDGCISARPHLSGQQRGLRLDLPPQEPQPRERPGERRCHAREQNAQPLWRPPRWRPQEPHVVGTSYEQRHPIEDRRRPLCRVDFPFGGHNACHLQLAAGHEPAEGGKVG